MSEFTHRLPHQPWGKPSRNEEQYFHREEFKSRMAVARVREARRAFEERQRWIEAHANHCPKCGGRLEEIRTAEGAADQCPSCLGVWLDHETFDRLTHPEKPGDDYLTSLFREVLLEYTTGSVTRRK
jgi:uncharacterized protein